MKMVVLGTGYLGATHAACMAQLGHEVLGVDTDPAKLAKLAAGEVPFFEPGLSEVLGRATSNGRLRFSSSLSTAARRRQSPRRCWPRSSPELSALW